MYVDANALVIHTHTFAVIMHLEMNCHHLTHNVFIITLKFIILFITPLSVYLAKNKQIFLVACADGYCPVADL